MGGEKERHKFYHAKAIVIQPALGKNKSVCWCCYQRRGRGGLIDALVTAKSKLLAWWCRNKQTMARRAPTLRLRSSWASSPDGLNSKNWGVPNGPRMKPQGKSWGCVCHSKLVRKIATYGHWLDAVSTGVSIPNNKDGINQTGTNQLLKDGHQKFTYGETWPPGAHYAHPIPWPGWRHQPCCHGRKRQPEKRNHQNLHACARRIVSTPIHKASRQFAAWVAVGAVVIENDSLKLITEPCRRCWENRSKLWFKRWFVLAK